MRFDTKHLSETKVYDAVWEAIGSNKCHNAFNPLIGADSRENTETWDQVLASLRGGYGLEIYVRGTLNLIMGNHNAAYSYFIRFTQDTGKFQLRENVAALQMWSGRLEKAMNNFVFVAEREGEKSWAYAYIGALLEYREHGAILRSSV